MVAPKNGAELIPESTGKVAAGRPAQKQISTVTISRQMGSQGYEVAHAVAKALDFKLIWRELINQAALRAGTPEVALATIDEFGLLGLTPSPKDSKVYLKALRKVMVELSKQGKFVIVGRAGQVILQNHPDVIHIRIIASERVRAERIAVIHDISTENALAQIQTSDNHRRKFLKQFYHVDWDDPGLYDLVINTDRFTIDVAAKLIISALSDLPENLSKQSSLSGE